MSFFGLFGPDVKKLIQTLKDEKDSLVRENAADALGEISDPRVIEQLIFTLKDENSDVRSAAAKALGKIRDPRAVNPLITALKDKNSDYVQQIAAESLGKIGDARAVDPLLATFKGRGFSHRYAVERALIMIGSCGVNSLILALEGKEKKVREVAAKALGLIGDIRAVDPLIVALKDNNRDVYRAAAVALDTFNWKPTTDENSAWYWIAKGDWEKCVLIGTEAVDPLLAKLEKGNYKERKACAMILGKIGDARAIEPLIIALKDENMYVREEATAALEKIGGARAHVE